MSSGVAVTVVEWRHRREEDPVLLQHLFFLLSRSIPLFSTRLLHRPMTICRLPINNLCQGCSKKGENWKKIPCFKGLWGTSLPLLLTRSSWTVSSVFGCNPIGKVIWVHVWLYFGATLELLVIQLSSLEHFFLVSTFSIKHTHLSHVCNKLGMT